jgi:hypothetical protein
MWHTSVGTVLTTKHMRTEIMRDKRRDNIKIAVTEMRCNAVDETNWILNLAATDILFSIIGKLNVYTSLYTEWRMVKYKCTSTHSWPRKFTYMQVNGLPHEPTAMPPGENALYLVNSRLGGSLIRSRLLREQKNQFIMPEIIEARVLSVVCILVTVLTEISHIATSFLLLGRDMVLRCSAENYRCLSIYTE